MIEWNKSWGERIYTTRIGLLFVLVFENVPEVFEDETKPANFNWYLCLDSDDKCDERALVQGNETSLEDVEFEVRTAVRRLITEMETDLARHRRQAFVKAVRE